MAVVVEQLAGRGQVAPADPPIGDVAYWAEDVDEPIRLARSDCCDRYVCRCHEEREEAPVAR